jgi:hypothetical protein
MDLIAFPFKFKPDGSVSKVTQTSDAHTAQRIYGFVKTTSGELPLALGYGLTDPVFANVELGEVTAGISLYHPDIVVDASSTKISQDGKLAVAISFIGEESIYRGTV